MTEAEKLATANLVSYRQEPKWAGKMFTHDENIMYIDGFVTGYQCQMKDTAKYHSMVEDMKADMCSTDNHVLCDYLSRLLKKYGEIV